MWFDMVTRHSNWRCRGYTWHRLASGAQETFFELFDIFIPKTDSAMQPSFRNLDHSTCDNASQILHSGAELLNKNRRRRELWCCLIWNPRGHFCFVWSFSNFDYFDFGAVLFPVLLTRNHLTADSRCVGEPIPKGWEYLVYLVYFIGAASLFLWNLITPPLILSFALLPKSPFCVSPRFPFAFVGRPALLPIPSNISYIPFLSPPPLLMFFLVQFTHQKYYF